ncbi:MAG: 3-methyl-2-oxobutanoate dehydrogenase subunit VorB [Parcubacteria group bacterium GW2011_GWA2_38_13b]|nr:MAG: 3-methyl-2-oxobutanoate dehydrogenase subunit VorB [Parcubacteria group bacterium GW2011_GWA2_38_13b]
MGKIFMKGNEAIAEAAIRAGLNFYAGYPITPATEILEYLARHLPVRGGVFVQAASEIEAINMVYGAAAGGARAMTSSSGPGMSLKMECISYIALAELPCVIVDIMRGGPGLGDIQPAQSDYFQIVKGGGHGDYRLIVLAPSTVQEAYDLTFESFLLADRWRIPVIILGDGALGQVKEGVDLYDKAPVLFEKPWALSGAKGRKPNKIVPFNLEALELEKMNLALQNKYRAIEAQEVRFENVNINSKTKLIVVAYGTCGRIAKSIIKMAVEKGLDIGLIRLISLWPFPHNEIRYLARNFPSTKFLVVEMSAGQMVEDVRLSVSDDTRVSFFGRMGGVVPAPEEILREIERKGLC